MVNPHLIKSHFLKKYTVKNQTVTVFIESGIFLSVAGACAGSEKKMPTPAKPFIMLVGARGFEPPTYGTQNRANLSYAPLCVDYYQ